MNEQLENSDVLTMLTERMRAMFHDGAPFRLFCRCIECAKAGDQKQRELLWNKFVKAKDDYWRQSVTYLPKERVVCEQLIREAKDIMDTYEKKTVKSQKPPKIFISHSSKDRGYASLVVELLEEIGLRGENIFCSSVAGYGIPLDENIYAYLQQQFDQYNLHVIFILSDNYYGSAACLNEMGAAWVLKNRYTSILLPDFEFHKIAGAIDPRQIGLKLTNSSTALADEKERLGQLKDGLLSEFALLDLPAPRWEQKRDRFIQAVANIHTQMKPS